MTNDTDFPPILSRPNQLEGEFLKAYLPSVPNIKKPQGYYRENLEGERSYSQTGTGIPDVGVQQTYGQKEGGPVFEQTIAGGIPVGADPIFPMSQEEFRDLIYQNLDKNKPTPPLPSRIQERLQNFKKQYGHLFV